jgi:orotidine-5'-phosphate decarboxylase
MTAAAAPAAVRRRLGLALDVPDLEAALDLARLLAPWFGVAKVGAELFVSAGPEVVRALVGEGLDVFLDLKFHDIPTTVGRAAKRAGMLGATFLTVHAAGGAAMVGAAVEGFAAGCPGPRASTPGATDPDGSSAPASGGDGGVPGGATGHRPGVLAVTVLTSEADAPIGTLFERAEVAAATGCAGVVCAAGDIVAVRQKVPDLLAVVPGIRLPEAALDDQQRTATPGAATRAGAGLLVVGRTVTSAGDPVEAARRVAADVEAVLGPEK